MRKAGGFTEIEKKRDFLVNISFISVILIMIYLVSRFMLSFLLPFIIGLLLSYLVQKPAVKIAQKTVLSKGVCASVLVTVTYVFVITAVIFIGIWAFNMLSDFISNNENIKSIEFALEKMQRSINNVLQNFPEDFAQNISLVFAQLKEDALSRLAGFVSAFATNTARSVPSFLFGCVVTIVASFYIAKDYDKLFRFVSGFLSKKTVDNIKVIKDIIAQNILSFAKGYVILLAVTFAELLVGFWLLGIKRAVFLAVIIALVDVLPVIGTGTVLIPWALLNIFTDNISKGILLLLLYILITVIRNFIEPKIIGEKMGLNPLFMLIVIFVGLRLAGVAGMLILPIALIVVINFYKRQMIDEKELDKSGNNA